MRRLFFVLLLAILPLQLSAAALMPYCQHDGAADWHLGHHEHLHVADADDGGDGGDARTSLNFDCGHCHAGAAALPTLPAPLPQALPRSEQRRGMAQHGPTRALAPPDRPQWPGLA